VSGTGAAIALACVAGLMASLESTTTARGLRDRAIMLLMARLGLRWWMRLGLELFAALDHGAQQGRARLLDVDEQPLALHLRNHLPERAGQLGDGAFELLDAPARLRRQVLQGRVGGGHAPMIPHMRKRRKWRKYWSRTGCERLASLPGPPTIRVVA